MTFGFALIFAGFILLDAGWKGVTPVAVLQGVTAGQKGAGGALKAASEGIAVSFRGNPEGVTPAGGNTPPAGVKNLKGKPQHIEQELKRTHPELKKGVRIVTAVILAQFPGLTITSTTGGNHVSDSYHYKGRAVDLGGSSQEMLRAAAWIAKFLTHILVEGIHNPNLSVKNHVHVDPSVFAEVWEEHKDHIHVAV